MLTDFHQLIHVANMPTHVAEHKHIRLCNFCLQRPVVRRYAPSCNHCHHLHSTHHSLGLKPEHSVAQTGSRIGSRRKAHRQTPPCSRLTSMAAARSSTSLGGASRTTATTQVVALELSVRRIIFCGCGRPCTCGARGCLTASPLGRVIVCYMQGDDWSAADLQLVCAEMRTTVAAWRIDGEQSHCC